MTTNNTHSFKLLAEIFGGAAAAIVTIPTVIAYALIVFGNTQISTAQLLTIGLFSPILAVVATPLFSKISGQVSGPKAPSALFLAVIVTSIQNVSPNHIIDTLIIVLLISATFQFFTAKMIAGASSTFPSEAIDGFMIGVGFLLVIKSFKYSLGAGLGEDSLQELVAQPTGQFFLLATLCGLGTLVTVTLFRYGRHIYLSSKGEDSSATTKRILCPNLSFCGWSITTLLFTVLYLSSTQQISGAPLIALITLSGYFIFGWVSRAVKRKLPISLLAFGLGVFAYHGFAYVTGEPQLFGKSIPATEIGFTHLPFDYAVPQFSEGLSWFGLTSSCLQIFVIYPLLLSFIVSLDSVVSAKALAPRVSLNQEIKPQSIINFVAALFCAFPGGTSFPRTKELIDTGAGSKASGVAVTIFLLLPFAFPQLLSYLPLPVISAIVMASGFKIIHKKVADGLLLPSHRDFPVSIKDKEATFTRAVKLTVKSLLSHLYSVKLVVLAVVLIMLTRSSIDGLIAGFAFYAMLMFMHFGKHYRKKILSIAEIKGNKLRTKTELKVLQQKAASVAIIQLEGLLFSLNVDDLCRDIEEKVTAEDTADWKYIIIDFDDLRIMMYESISLLVQTKEDYQDRATVIFCNIGSSLLGGESFKNHYLENFGKDEHLHLLEKPLNEAVKWSEDDILHKQGIFRPTPFSETEFSLLECLKRENLTELLVHNYMSQESFPSQETVICEGKKTDQKLYFILEGEAKITMRQHYEQSQDFTEIIHFQPGDVFGVLSFFDRQAAEVSVVAETPLKALSLSRAKLNQFKDDYPTIGKQLEEEIITLLCSRIRYFFGELREIGR